MMGLRRCLIATAAVFVASSNPCEGTNKVQIFTSGNDAYSNAFLTSRVVPVFLSPCGAAAEWSINFAGITNETTPGVFECLGGKENCAYLEGGNCLHEIMATPQGELIVETITTAILGRGGVDAIANQLTRKFKAELKECVSSGRGKKLLHGATAETHKLVTWDDEYQEDNVAILINGNQYDGIWDDTLWPYMCSITKDERCCIGTIPPPQQQKVSTMQTKYRHLLSKVVATKPDIVELSSTHQDRNEIKHHELRGAASSKYQANNHAARTMKPKFGLWSSGNDEYSSYLLLYRAAPVLYSPCGPKIDWSFIFAGMSEETSPGSFNCFEGEKNCQFLEAMNCASVVIKSDSEIPPYLASERVLITSILGRDSVSAVKDLVYNRTALEKCISSGQGKTLLSDAIKETQKTIHWDERHTYFVGLTVNGAQVDDLWMKDLFDIACNTTNERECCFKKEEKEQYQQTAFMTKTKASHESFFNHRVRDDDDVLATE